MLLFSGLALYAVLGQPTWSVIGVRLCVDAGLLAIVLALIGAVKFTGWYPERAKIRTAV